MIASNYSFGFERNEKQLKANNEDQTKWTNPLEIQYASLSNARSAHLHYRLPNAPSLKIICVYGHGLQTEVRLQTFIKSIFDCPLALLLVCAR